MFARDDNLMTRVCPPENLLDSQLKLQKPSGFPQTGKSNCRCALFEFGGFGNGSFTTDANQADD